MTCFTRSSTWTMMATLIVASVALTSCKSMDAGSGIINGTLTYGDRTALGAGSSAVVELVRMNGGSAVSNATFKPTGQPPFAFTLSYDPKMIDVNMAHALRARITTADGSATYMTESDVPVVFDGQPVGLMLVRMGSGSTASPRR